MKIHLAGDMLTAVCGGGDKLVDLLTRTREEVTCRACLRKSRESVLFKLTYVFRLVFGIPLVLLGLIGDTAYSLHGKLLRVTWAPKLKRKIDPGQRQRVLRRFVQ